MILLNVTKEEAELILKDLDNKLTDTEKEHPGVAWYLSQLKKLTDKE